MSGNKLLNDVKRILQDTEASLCELNQLDLDKSIKQDIYLIRLNLMLELVELEKKYL